MAITAMPNVSPTVVMVDAARVSVAYGRRRSRTGPGRSPDDLGDELLLNPREGRPVESAMRMLPSCRASLADTAPPAL